MAKPAEPVAPAVTAKKPASKAKAVKPEAEVTIDAVKPVILEVPVKIEINPTSSSKPSTPDAIIAAIMDQFKNDNNNNIVDDLKNKKQAAKKAEVVSKAAPAVAAATATESLSKVAKNDKKTKSNIASLKQTNLSGSMVLIDSDLSKSNSTKTDSNHQSSSESLQDLDVDGDEGWATITSKKKRTVRREV